MNTQLLLIDCQNDFASWNDGYKGSLFVPGADEDMERLAQFINKNQDKIDGIHLTIDSHRTIQIFHPCFWINAHLEHPKPFTPITFENVRDGVWQSENPKYQKKALRYVTTLAKTKRNPLVIWPYHCLEGSTGQALVPCISNAVQKWEIDQADYAEFYYKGLFTFTEQYGVFESEVPALGKSYIGTEPLLEICAKCKTLIVAGEALSHCVKSSIEQLLMFTGKDQAKKIILLKDCCSNVATFEKQGGNFIKYLVDVGGRVISSSDVQL